MQLASRLRRLSLQSKKAIAGVMKSRQLRPLVAVLRMSRKHVGIKAETRLRQADSRQATKHQRDREMLRQVVSKDSRQQVLEQAQELVRERKREASTRKKAVSLRRHLKDSTEICYERPRSNQGPFSFSSLSRLEQLGDLDRV